MKKNKKAAEVDHLSLRVSLVLVIILTSVLLLLIKVATSPILLSDIPLFSNSKDISDQPLDFKKEKPQSEKDKALYAKNLQELSSIIQAQNPKIALEELSHRVNSNNDIASFCHALTHELGRISYAKYKNLDTTLSYQDDVCGSGYLHGVIESRIGNAKNILEELRTVCMPMHQGRCYHAAGHGLMFYTANNLPKALDLCDFYTKSQKIYCLEGVFMENYITDQKTHPSKYLNSQDPFFPCRGQNALREEICYFYTPRYYVEELHKNDYKGALDMCDKSGNAHKISCTRGVGSVLAKHNFKEPKTIEALCMSGQKNQVASCIDGALGYYIVNFNSVQKGYDLCNGFADSHNKYVCYQAVPAHAN